MLPLQLSKLLVIGFVDGIHALDLELVSKELNHFGEIASFFRDGAPGILTGGE